MTQQYDADFPADFQRWLARETVTGWAWQSSWPWWCMADGVHVAMGEGYYDYENWQ